MSTYTTLMSLGKAVGADVVKTYLKTTLAAALDALDAHTHANASGAPVQRIQSGTAATRPVAGNAGHVYGATDTGTLSLDTGGAWTDQLSNPMTSVGDLIKGGTAGAPSRVPIGAAGTVLTSDGSTAGWGNGPMTTAADLIVGGASGVPTRLAKGTAFQLLRMNAGATAEEWAAWHPVYAVVSKVAADSPYTALATDDVILCNATAGAITVALPTAVGITGRAYTIKKTDSSANAVTIDPNAAETVDGSATKAIVSQNAAYTVMSDGTNWRVV